MFLPVPTDTSSIDNAGTVIIDVSNRRWRRETGGLNYSVKWFGAKADCTGFGVGTDNTAFFQSCFNAAVAAGSSISIPAGSYRMTGPVTVNVSSPIGLTTPLPEISGSGARTTTLLWDASTSQTNGLRYIGSTSNNPGVHSVVKLRGFSLMKPDGVGFGLVLEQHAHIHVEDVICYQWNYGCTCVDVQSALFENAVFIYNLHGFQAYRQTFTEPNAFSFISCEFGGNQNWGCNIVGGSPVNFSGGAIEGNGGVGTDTSQWGVRIVDGPGDPQEGSASATFTAVYFERNAGYGDIYFSNSQWPNTMTVTGCTFNRADNTGKYGTNCIRIETYSGVNNIVNIRGCGFQGLGGYPPSSARPYIGIVNPAQPLLICDEGNIYSSLLEAPPWPQGSMLAAAVIDGTGAGSLKMGKNIRNFGKNATGSYEINWIVPGTTPAPVFSITSNMGTRVDIITVDQYGIAFSLLSSSGTPADANYISVIVFG